MELKIQTQYYGEVVFLIDDEDFEWVKALKSLYAGYEPQIKSFRLMSQHKAVARKIMNCPPGYVVYHDNGSLDCRKKHLIVCLPDEVARLMAKKKKDSSSKYIGVCWHKAAKKWAALIRADKQQLYLGVFSNEEDAAKAYNKAAIKYHGKDAKLNELGKGRSNGIKNKNTLLRRSNIFNRCRGRMD